MFAAFARTPAWPDVADTATVEQLRRFTKTIVTRAVNQVYAPYRDNELRDLVDKVHSERPPMVQTPPDEFVRKHFARHPMP